ncbi:ubiquitin-protein ligase [Laetiporus sulphureus 93-53]|uniref:Anaphase-promoting complex subunit 2 n=1 Tax=Laetiporus sulphureus 93-53 TaxID=1314785 RepID=A0A165HRJ5_9APHY|nr:ubiquitin-protein ligase [Laetiporus sulphureus 93-53]KZT12088.1 ubiquitin-protein ligase [Laetiporus sulphureus 93-53]
MATEALQRQIQAKWEASFSRLNRDQPGISGLLTTSQAWEYIAELLRPRSLNDPSPRREIDVQRVKSVIDFLTRCKLTPSVVENFLDEMRKQQHLITRDVHEYMIQYERTTDIQFIARLIFRLSRWHKAWEPAIELGQTTITMFNSTFQTHVFSILPPPFFTGFKEVVKFTLTLADMDAVPGWMTEATPDNNGHSELSSRPDYSFWMACQRIGLLDRYESLVSSILYEQIEAHVWDTCTGKWGEPVLKDLRQWMNDELKPWMMLPFGKGAKGADESRSAIHGMGSRCDFHICKTLCELRIREIFDIIIDYPDSIGALLDLKECLNRVDQRDQLVQALRKANKKRLLHPGADTKDILTQYVSIIRCLRILDPPGVLLFKVADPIRRYLRERPDTIRCIVASLVGDGESGDSLVDENEPIQPLQQAQVEDYTDPSWEPEPIDAGPDFRSNKPGDVISTLVSIYDSKDLFVKELQVLLAQRLLAITDGNFERERRNIEILKIRFGEAALQVCEVMLRDMTDSKRIDQHVQSQKNLVLHPTIISRHFWPPLQAGKFVMPGQFKQVQDEYAKEFMAFKPDKKLRWLPHLGTIHLQLELEDRTISADVPPLEAAFIELFSQKDSWTVDELIAQVGSVERAAALKALATWVDLGVLKDRGGGNYILSEIAEDIAEPGAKTLPARPAQIVEDIPAVTSVQQQQAEQMQVFWRFIEGMLTNLGTLPLDRIQTMLKFAPGYDRTIEQLGAFMEAARREGLVTVKDGMWKLNRH